jgi:hypothetical protein
MTKPKITAHGLYPSGSKWDKGEEPPSEKEVQTCLRWLAKYAEPSDQWGRSTSYGYKHDVETWAGDYVTNGAFIEAAQRAGYEWKRDGPRSPNAVFKMRVNPEGLR